MAEYTEWDEELRADFYIRQPSSSSDAERVHAAQQACEARGKQLIEEWNRAPLPVDFEFYAVKLLRLENVRTKTKKNPVTDERHHECKGTGVAKLLYKLTAGTALHSAAAEMAHVSSEWSAPMTEEVMLA